MAALRPDLKLAGRYNNTIHATQDTALQQYCQEQALRSFTVKSGHNQQQHTTASRVSCGQTTCCA